MKKLSFILILTVLIIIGVSHYDEIKEYMEGAYHRFNKSDLVSLISNGELISDSDLASLQDSDIKGQDKTFDTTYYPYYGFLQDNQKSLYKQIYANVNELSTTFIPVSIVSVEEAQDAIEAIYCDHPELFWLDTSYSYKYTANGNCAQITMEFNETSKNVNTSKTLFEAKAKTIIDKANTLTTNYEKEKYVHDAIIEGTTYDKNASMNQSAYSALVNGKTVCAGYARAFQYIMIKLNIPAYFCEGDANGNHAWNIVKLSDGYYNVDLTWDDSNIVTYQYFNGTDSDFDPTHTRRNASVSLPSCSATTYRNLENSSEKLTNHISNTKKWDNSNTDVITNQNTNVITNETKTDHKEESNRLKQNNNTSDTNSDWKDNTIVNTNEILSDSKREENSNHMENIE